MIHAAEPPATLAAEAVARATLRAVQAARSITTAEGLHLPGLADGDWRCA